MTVGRQSLLVYRRQLRAALADPGPSFVLPMMPPLLMLVVFTSVFDPLASLGGFDTAGFTTDSWDAFLLPGVVILVALLGGGYTSASLAADLRTGYAERLVMAGGGPTPMLVGRLLVELVRMLPGAVIVTIVGFGFGGEADNGVAGIAVVVGLVALLGASFTGVFYLVAIATEDPQTPFTMAPLGLPLSFLSSALVPITIMPQWSEVVARVNPVSVVVDAGRHAMIGDLWSSELGLAVVILGGWLAATQVLAWRALDNKLMRG